MQRNDPKDMWHLLKRLSFAEGKAKLAQSFNLKSLTDKGKDPDYNFDDYLQDLYKEDGPITPLTVPDTTAASTGLAINDAAIIKQMKRLSNKATGVDQLSSKDLKKFKYDPDVTIKLMNVFTEWSKTKTPDYI